MTDYSAATINTGNALASRLVVAAGAGRLQNIVDNATLTTNGTVTATTDGWTFGSGASIVLPDTLLTQFTLFVWAFGAGSTSALVSRSAGSANGYNQNYALRLQSGITPRGEFKEDFTANYPTLSSSGSGTNGTLLTAAFSYDGTNQEIYLNGTSTGTQSAPAPWTSSSTGMVTQIGAVDGTERALNYSGNGIQLVLIFNAALTDAEITSLHSNPDQVFNLVGDTTAPVLTSAVGTATGATTATVGATTDEANGTLRVVVTTSATQPSIAQIKAGQNDGGTAAAYAGSQTITTTGAKTFSATGLTASTTYYAHLLHTDAAANDSNRITSSSFTTTTPDTTAPTLSSGVGTVKSNALIVVGATTNEANGTMYVVVTTSATPPSAAQVKLGQNNGGTAAVFAANQAIGSTGAKTFNATGLTQLTGYYPYIVHTDASGNDSSVLSIGLRTTFRNGATGQSVVDDTAAIPGVQEQGFLYNDVTLPADADKWFSYTIATPAVDSASLTLYANGSFIWTGLASDSFTYQLEVDGANVGSPALVTLTASGADVTAPTLSSATGTKTGTSTATGTVTTNEANGTLYYLTNTSSSALSAAVLAGSTQTVTTSGVQNISRSGLSAATTYYHHYLHRDAAGNDSAVLSSNSFTTDAAADVTPPTLTSPTGATLGPTGAVGSVSTNEANGTLYWLTNTSATATDAAIKAANSQPVTATGVQNVTSSGLTASTLYYNHFLHRDAAGNDSTRSTSASFTTAATGGPVTGNDHGGEAMRSCMRLAMYPAMNQG